MSGVKIKRLRELSLAIADGLIANQQEFNMRVPAEPDRDADLVLMWAADEITRLRAEQTRLKEHVGQLQHIISEEATDSGQVILERDALALLNKQIRALKK